MCKTVGIVDTPWKAAFDEVAREFQQCGRVYRNSGVSYDRVTSTIGKALGLSFPDPEQDPRRAAAVEEGMRKGTCLDADIENLLQGRAVYVNDSPEEVERRHYELQSFTFFWAAHEGFGLEIIGTQVRVGCKTMRLCGTADVVARVKNADLAQKHLPGFPDARVGDIVIIDVKRTSRRYMDVPFYKSTRCTAPGLTHVWVDSCDTYRLQLTAYRRLFRSTYHTEVKPKALFILAFHARENCWCVWPVEACDHTLDTVAAVSEARNSSL